MPTLAGKIPHFSDTTPAAAAGRMNAKIATGTPYAGTLLWNGIEFAVEFTDLSWNVPNFGGVNAQTGTSYTLAAGDQGKMVTLANASAVAVALPATLGATFVSIVENFGPGTATLTPASGTINGAASLMLVTGSGALLFFDGTNWEALTGGGSSIVHKVGVTIDGFDSVIQTGVKGSIQVDFAGTIIGWSIEADQAGSISVEVDKSASSAPPSAPSIPNTTTDKISASAPIALSSAQSAAAAASGVSTWTTAVAQWDSIQFNVTAAATLKRVALYIRIQGS